MARHVEGPWFRGSKNTWYATINGNKVSLKVRGEGNRGEATRAWHRLMAGGDPVAVAPPTTPAPVEAQPKAAPDPTVGDVTTGFLSSRRGRVKERTHYVYACLAKRIVTEFGPTPTSLLKAGDVLRWLAQLPVSRSTRSDIAGVLASSFKWAEEESLIPRNPLKGTKWPTKASRGTKAVVDGETHRRLLEAATPALRLLLTLLHETGARPSELTRLTAADVDLKNGAAVLADHKTADATGKPRLIVLTPRAVELLSAQVAEYPTGELVRNSRGTRWTKDSICLAVRRAANKAGVRATSYGMRHTYATNALSAGVPDAIVSTLLGHSSTAMLHKHYSHLTSQATVLRNAAALVRPAGTEGNGPRSGVDNGPEAR